MGGDVVKRLAVMAMACAVIFAATGCEPAMTITAKNKPEQGEPDDGLLSCGASMHVVGVVTPHAATSAVQLQRTVGGKWVDVKGWGSQAAFTDQYIDGTQATPRRAAVSKSSGAYTINYYPAGLPVETPLHFRVRSNAGSAASPAFYESIEFC
jgi:ABC-type phosphate transport system substrate-binding protein